MLRRAALTLVRRSVERPALAIALMSVLTLAAVPGLARLELRTDGHALVPADDPAVLYDAEVRQRFGLRDVVVVLVESDQPEGIYNLATLTRVAEMTDAVAAVEGIGRRNVMSLATERRDRVYPGTLSFRPFLDPLPDNSKLMQILREDVAATGIVEGTLVSADGRATALMVGVPGPLDPDAGDRGDRTAIYQRLKQAVEPFAEQGDRVLVVGAPVAESQLGTHVLEDLRLLVPLALLVIAGIVWLGCRRLWGVALALAEVGACQLFTFGVMGWAGSPVFLTTAVLPVVLVTIGLADEIHIFWHYQRRLAGGRRDEPPRRAVLDTMTAMASPVVLTSLTTGIAFLSFLASSIDPVRFFGLYAAVGIFFCMLWSLTVVPAALSRLPRRFLEHPSLASRRRGGWAARLATPAVGRPRVTLAALAAITLALALGLPRLVIQDSWLDGFAPDSPLRRDTARVNEQLHGTHILLVEVDFDPAAGAATATVRDHSGPLLVPANLEALGRLEEAIRAQPTVGGVLGPYSHLTAVSYLWQGRRPGTRSIPTEPPRVDLVYKRFATGRGEHRLREVIAEDLRHSVLTVYLEHANYRDTAALMRSIRAYASDHLTELGATVRFAGDVAVSQAMIPAIVRTQVSSLLLALGGALLVVSLLYRSLRAGILVVLPAGVAVLWVFGAMAWSGLPLGVATSMFCAITLGVGVDYGIHFYERHRRRAEAGDPDPLASTLDEAAPAISTDAVAIALGFGLLMFSQVPANARLGLLVAVALLASCLLTLTGLGSLLALRRRPHPAVAVAPASGDQP